MRCFECRYLDRSKVLTCYPPKYYCTYDKTTHFADDECKYEHYPIVRCKDCKHQEHCHETVAHTRIHDGFNEHWSEQIEWCSRGESKGDDSE